MYMYLQYIELAGYSDKAKLTSDRELELIWENIKLIM